MATVTGTKRHLGITSDTYDSSGDVVVGGNLTVEGTTTTLDTANLLVEDKNIIIGNVSTPSDTTADGGGITLKGASDYTINWVNANDRWEFNQGIHSTGNITGANLSGTNTGDQDLSGYSTSDTTYTAGNGLSLSGTEFRMAGGSIGASVDLDTYTSSGYYVQGSNSNTTSGTNWPVEKAGILTVVRAQGNTTHITQTYDQYNSSAFYNRSYYNGTWSSWRDLAQDTNTQRAVHDTPVDAATTTSISSNWAFDNVKTAVPANALFTDTTYNLSGYLLNTTDTLTGTLTVDTDLSGTGDANRGFTATKTNLGAVHAAGGEGGVTTSADTTPMITIPGNTAGQVQGGIYASQNSSTGTSISIFTTDSYSTGPQQSLTVLDNGNVSVNRGTLSVSGNITGGNLSGTNTGDQDLSGYLTTGFSDYVSKASGGQFDGFITIKEDTNGGTTTGKSFLTLHNDNSDIAQQQSFIDFKFTDTNANYTPQVRIGAQVGPDADANAISKEGAGSFVVYTAPIGSDESGNSSGLTESMRVSHDGDVTIAGSVTANGTVLTGDQDLSGYLTSYSETDTLDTVCDRGADTDQTIKSTNALGFRVDSAGSARIEIENGGSNWAYLRLRDDSTVSWDIASYNGGDLELRPAGSGTNGYHFNSSGVFTSGDAFTSTKGNTAYDHSQATHAPTNAEQNVQSDWNATSGDALILNKPSIPAASGKGQGIDYIASNLPSSNSTYRDNFGAGVWAYSGYSTGTDRPFTYDATLQIMPTANLGFELSTSWHSTGEGSLKIRALRDCCEGWGDYHDVWTSDNFANNSANWNSAYAWGDHASAGYVESDSNFLKSNADDTFTGRLSVGSTNSRRAGMYGIYDSNKTGHIWSMGTGYMIPSNGSDFGNLYGLAYKHTNNTTGGTMAGGHQMVWCSNGTGKSAIGDNIWTSGNVTHNGLTMTDGTDIDQIKSYVKSLALTSAWQDTGVNGAELATGTYTIQVTVNNSGANGQQYNEMYSGTMTWYSDNTNSTDHDEIVLHAAGHARNGKSIFLRTLRTVSADANDLKLQIRDNRNATQTATNYTFKFRRLI